MKMRLMLTLLTLIIATPGYAQQQSLIGTWEIVEAQPAPWTPEKSARLADR